MNALDNLMNQAETAATNFTPPMPMPTQSYQTGAIAKPSVADFLDSGGADVDVYVKLKDTGFKIGAEMQGLLEELVVEVDLSEIAAVRIASFGKGTFVKTYDGVTTPEGKNFDLELNRMLLAHGNQRGPYPTFEVPMTLISDLKDPKSSHKLDVGTRVGYTPSMSGYKAVKRFLQKLRAENPSILDSTVNVKIKHVTLKNSENEWPSLDFELA